MTDTPTLIATHLEAYGQADPERRRRLIGECWAPDGILADPPLDATGHDGIDALFAAVQGQVPGVTFRRTSGIDEHHGVARYSWDMLAADGTVAASGIDVAHVDDGLLTRVTGFFEPLPELVS